MNHQIPIYIAIEDALSESVVRKLLRECGRNYVISLIYPARGFGYLRANIVAFNNVARVIPFLLLTDLDQIECAPILINNWLAENKHHNLIFRVAVREVESWLMADRKNLVNFLGISNSHIPSSPEEVDDPKKILINAAKRSKKKKLKRDIVPPEGSPRIQGPNYNERLKEYIENHWRPEIARQKSDSLDRAMKALDEFEPVWLEE
jgi:hypothetical protein